MSALKSSNLVVWYHVRKRRLELGPIVEQPAKNNKTREQKSLSTRQVFFAVSCGTASDLDLSLCSPVRFPEAARN